MVTRHAPSAWRAISPVSRVTVCCPKGNDFLIDFTFCPVRGAGIRPHRRRPRKCWRGPKTTNPARSSPEPRGVVSSGKRSLLAQAEALDERAVGLDVGALEVVEQAAPLAHELEQPPARMEILGMRFEVIREHVDACRLDRDLHF